MLRSLAVTALLATTLALSACGGGGDPATETAPAAPATGAPTSGAPTSGAAATGAAGAAGAVTFQGVTVSNPSDLSHKPQTTSTATGTPQKLEYKDLVVGKGAKADPSSTVNVQYDGLLYASGKPFQASWDLGGATSFSLTGVVPGFTEGIGGTTGVPPMKAGGRRILILPAALGYGASGTPDGSIPPNTPIVFVVDLVSVK